MERRVLRKRLSLWFEGLWPRVHLPVSSWLTTLLPHLLLWLLINQLYKVLRLDLGYHHSLNARDWFLWNDLWSLHHGAKRGRALVNLLLYLVKLALLATGEGLLWPGWSSCLSFACFLFLDRTSLGNGVFNWRGRLPRCALDVPLSSLLSLEVITLLKVVLEDLGYYWIMLWFAAWFHLHRFNNYL